MNNWKDIALKPEDTLEIAIKVLHSGGKRISVVIDSNYKLLGTITDGDIRRALIKQVGMAISVMDVMNSSPVTALKTDDPKQIMAKMKSLDLLHIPIIDKDGVLMDIETLQHLIGDNQYDNPIFLMAGGFGTRLHPLTKNIPKPLLKVGDRPILETIITQFIDAGFHDFYISTHYRADMVRAHFGDGSDWGITISYVYEEQPLGTAGALGLLHDMQIDLPIIMMNCDILTKINFEHLMQFHKEEGGVATMCVREYDIQVPYGVVSIEEHIVSNIVEKPVHKFFVNAGIYVLNSEIVRQVDGKSFLDMPDLLTNNISQGKHISSFPIHEYWIDIGRMEEYSQAEFDIEKII